MQASLKWLLVPPALALLLFLGPLRDFGRDGGRDTGGAETASTEGTGAARPARTTGADRTDKATDKTTDKTTDKQKTLPALPSLPQTAGTLVFVLALGATFVWLLAKLKRRGAGPKGDLVVVRQSTRLSPRQQLHVVQWDDRLLLLGESDGKLAVLREAADPQVAADERAATSAADDDDDGAVPRDMLIPRAPAKAKAAATPAAAARPSAKARAALAEFKALLNRATVEQGAR